MDNAWIRKEFSLLDGTYFYFNNASTALKPNCVTQAILKLYQYHSDIFIGDYQNSDFVNEKILQCRKLVSQLINCDPEEVIFTSNCTDSLDRLAQVIDASEGDNIVCSKIDHNANFTPWLKSGAKIFLLDTRDDGLFDLEELENILKNNKIKIVSTLAVSNTAANIQDYKKITALAHSYGALVNVDFAQHIPHFPANFKDTDCDFACMSAHKIGGPCFGVLVGKKKILEKCYMDNYEHKIKNFYNNNNIPLKTLSQFFEFGSLQVLDIVAFSSALQYFLNLGYEKIFFIEDELKNYFLMKAEDTKLINFLFPMQKKSAPIFTFTFANNNIDIEHANKILLNDHKIILSYGSQCAQVIYKNYGHKAGLRASCSYYNTKAEIDYLFDKIKIISQK